MADVTHDFGDWPLLRIRVSVPPNPSVAEQIRAGLDLGLERAEAHAVIIVLERVGMPTPAMIREQARWFAERSEPLSQFCRGIAIATTSAAMRGIPNALSHIIDLPMRLRACKTEEEAEAWCAGKLER